MGQRPRIFLFPGLDTYIPTTVAWQLSPDLPPAVLFSNVFHSSRVHKNPMGYKHFLEKYENYMKKHDSAWKTHTWIRGKCLA